MAANSIMVSAVKNIRRPSGYSHQPIWNYDYVQSLTSEYHEEEAYSEQVNELKEKIRTMLKLVKDPLAQLEQIDTLQRLGIFYHFEDEVDSILKGIYDNIDSDKDVWNNNLYATALKFRLLRQHRYWVPQDVFNNLKNEKGNFKQACIDVEDVMGILALYEASFVLVRGETDLEEARDFTTKHLQEFVKHNKDENYLSMIVGHALEVPQHWSVPRVGARWFIDIYRRKEDMNPTFLKLAILDYNIVQSTHQQDLKFVCSWWRNTGLGQKLSFARDRLAEAALWNTGMEFQPQYGYCRRTGTKTFLLLTVVDDIFDSHGALHELEMLNKAFQSWDLTDIDPLPTNMKMSFLVVYNFVNELAFDILKEQEVSTIKCLRKLWADLSTTYLKEATWYNSGTTPPFEEYVENGWVSVAAPLALVIDYFTSTNEITEEVLELLLNGYPNIIRQSSLICRLTNDLATSAFEMEKGDNPTAIQCYMHDTGASEDEARKHIKFIIGETWKQMNEELAARSPFPRQYIKLVINLTRMTMWMYEGRDGYGVENFSLTKDYAALILANPIPF